MPSHRWRHVTARLDAPQQGSQVGLQLRVVIGRHDAVNPGRAVLARQAIGVEHPVQIDQVMQRVKHPLRVLARQTGYPLLFREQVCETQSSLPCFPSMVPHAWRPPFLEWVPASPVPHRHRYYEVATTSHGACPLAYGFAARSRMGLVVRVRRGAPDNSQVRRRAWRIVPPAPRVPATSCAHPWDLTGSLVTHPAPLPCSKTPAESVILALAEFPMLPPHPTRRRLQRLHDFVATTRL